MMRAAADREPPPVLPGGANIAWDAVLESIIDPLTIARPERDAEGHVVDFTYVAANRAACAWIGVDREHLLGRRMLDLYPEVTATGLLARYAATAKTGCSTVVEEFPFPLHGVGVRWIEVQAGRANDCVCFVWRDVSARHEAVRKLAASEERFRLLAENALDIVVHFGPDDRILWISPSVTRVLGWTVAGCIGRGALEFLATPESRDRYRHSKLRVAAGDGDVVRVEVLDSAGGVHWAEVRSSPCRMPDGGIVGMVSSTRIIDSEVQSEQALVRQARTDEVTGLLNRKEGLVRLDAIVRQGGARVAVLWCDIDRFKSVNDSHGHAAGDAVLQALAERIRGAMRSDDDVAARIGGDELLLVLRGVDDLDDAVAVAETLRRRVAAPIPVEAGMVRATVSIGVTLAGDWEGLDAILARADEAMYEAKTGGRDRVVALAPPPPRREFTAGDEAGGRE